MALRDGKNAGDLSRKEINHDNMVKLMIGRSLKNFYVPPASGDHPPRLIVKALKTFERPHQTIDVEARAGEILGVAGLVGAGRSEMARRSSASIRPSAEKYPSMASPFAAAMRRRRLKQVSILFPRIAAGLVWSRR